MCFKSSRYKYLAPMGLLFFADLIYYYKYVCHSVTKTATEW